jgi:acylphosphatase
VHLIQSSKDPIIAGHRDNLESEGFTVSSVTTSDSGKKLNLALADKINTTKFVIIDDSYGYNAISVAPYSIISNSCVLFADSENIDAVYKFLKGRTPEIIIYGRVDRAVREKLSEFNPEIIDHGDRFEDNLAIVDKYVALSQPTQIVLTNGEFIEDEIMSGREPVIFLGRDVVPAEVVEYVNAHDFKTGVVIGNDLTGAATKLKDQTGMSIFIKFGQGRAGGESGFAVPEVLDMFYLPQYELSLDIVSGDYNVKTKTTEIVYQNRGKTGVFAKATIGISAGNESVTTVGDEEPFFIDTETKFGRAYEADLTDWAANELQAHIYLEYGETRKSLTELVEKDIILGLLEFDDRSALSVTGVKYDTKLERLTLELKNTGTVTCYADAEVELRIEGESESVMFTPAEIKDDTVLSERIKLSSADLAENPTVFVHIRYGERSDMRLKTIDEAHTLSVVSAYPVEIIAVVAALLAVVVVIGLLLWIRKKK